MPRYFVAFGQFFDAPSKTHAYDMAMMRLWGSGQGFGVSITEVPEDRAQDDPVCVEVDPTTGVRHWRGAEQ